ncbi:hypothetical protein KP509_02G005000 [Ceratopteris richardii]|uniref:Uncharacterized protein n=1 Tax=Ceratopteris richardii TaxID=49495 RepID=A0A8T2VA71_CERRI|nr:hypothetical protein KP509_02G005000 [Ceratopteris richardii]KAH7442865.1 hypothetical protein KP509_02G005000 [Ceratopteris richardii]KAH7442866.1 hypothetical protein KP509_02G005000 [Ceratopteris richardii]
MATSRRHFSVTIFFTIMVLIISISMMPSCLIIANEVESDIIWGVSEEDAVQEITWNVTYGNRSPLGTNQQVLLINDQFPGPEIDTVTNVNLLVNVFNSLDEPLLITWNGIWQRRTSWQDGVLGTNCPIPPGQNFTYFFQVKDQVGSYFYFPSTGFLKAAGGYGGLKIDNRIIIPLPYPVPDGEAFLLIGDWYNTNHTDLQAQLDQGGRLGPPDGVVINGKGPFGEFLTVDPGKTYRLRICNVGISTSLNFRIANHNLTVVETEGSHTKQNSYENLDIHVGQCYSVLVTCNQAPADYYMVASTRFTDPVLNGIGVIHYSNSGSKVSGPLPPGPTTEIGYSIDQFRTITWNLTANAARPNPQGSFHYGMINVTETAVLEGVSTAIDGKQRYAVNGISYVNPDTPLKLADYFNIGGVFSLNFPRNPSGGSAFLGAFALNTGYRGFLELVFQNDESIVQSWHIDGYTAFVVGADGGRWTSASRGEYNLLDAVARSTVQVYPQSWTAVMLELDNVGMWNLRSQIWERQYLGEQLYFKVPSPDGSFRNEADIPPNALRCGKAIGH